MFHVHEDPWCADDEAWFHAGAPWKDCAWVFASPDHRCGAVGDDGSLASTKCLESCGCGGARARRPRRVPGLRAYDAETPPCGWFDADLACAATCAEDVLVFVADYCDAYSVDWVAIFGEADKTRRFPVGDGVAVAWTGPVAATVSATVVLAGVDAADFNADEEAAGAFRVAVAHTVTSPDVCPDPQSDWETCVSEPVAHDHDRRRRLLAGHDERRVDFSVAGLSEDPAALADGVVETLEASVADGVLETNLAQFGGGTALEDAAVATAETLVALESAGLPSPTGAPTDGSPEPTPAPTPEPTPEPTIFTVDDDGAGESPDLYTTTGTHYEGRLTADYPNGPAFDSSYKRREIAEFKPAQVISCWKYALQDMRPGDVWELVCPPETAYGKKGPTLARTARRPPVAAPGDDGDDDLVMSASADLEDLFSNTFVLGVTIWAAVTFCALGYFVYLKMKAKDEKPAAPVQAEARAVGPGEGDAAVEAEAVPSTPLVSEAHRRRRSGRRRRRRRRGPATVQIDGPSLGLAFGPDGRIRGVQPGGEGEAKGLARPLALTVEKPPPKERVAVTIDGPSLGLAFGPDGAVRGVQPGGEGEAKGVKVGEKVVKPGGEAETLGLQYSDKVVKVGDVWCEGEDEIKAAVAAHPQRPITITVARKKPKRAEPDEDPKRGYSDKVIKVGETWCEGEDEIKAAVAARRPAHHDRRRAKLPPSLVFGEVSQGPIIEQRDTDGDLDEIIIEYLDDDLERA
ncbi:hypothetical protein SO694_00051288 [Aureococcus anophagefferens]|uniref:peptidylprolyl isomerase n=1 Tax=Aureococcus anophagefferens TaxID=44056 RepID=A0ABR1FYI7_AURAN